MSYDRDGLDNVLVKIVSRCPRGITTQNLIVEATAEMGLGPGVLVYSRTYARLRLLDREGLIRWEPTDAGSARTYWYPMYVDLPPARDAASVEQWLRS